MIAGAGALAAVLLAVTMAPGFTARNATAEELLGMVRSMLREGDAADAPRVHFEEALRSYYGDSATAESAPDDSPVRLLWVDGGELSDRGEDLLDAIREAWREGIDPEAYRDSTVDGALARLERTRNALAAARSELLLSDAFLRLADRLARGSGDAPRAGLTWDIDPGEVDHAQLLRNLADGSSPGEELEELRSRLPWYEPMVEALDVYREIEQNGGWPKVPTGQSVALGDTSAAVAAVRERLAASPDEHVRELAEGADEPEVFDERLAGAVAAFQEHHGIAVDSVVGPGTLAAMNVSAAERVAELRLNLDRLRRLPPELGSRAILVNVAGYELVVLEGDEPVMQMDVVVGQPEWRTKIFEGELEYLVVHPYWHVPASIEAAEILPAVREDPSYLEREHLVVVDPADSYGPAVSTDDIDWDDVDPESFPYDFRQEPGPWNALGAVKFMFPNEYNIYLHDSPARELFQRHERAFSHGCIRVEKPLELARYLLEHASDVRPDELDDLLAEDERTQIDLTETIPVYIAYFTAWVDADGAVHFYPDVYDLDEPLPDAGA
jgi:L,D-transpeptidase YcbB